MKRILSIFSVLALVGICQAARPAVDIDKTINSPEQVDLHRGDAVSFSYALVKDSQKYGIASASNIVWDIAAYTNPAILWQSVTGTIDNATNGWLTVSLTSSNSTIPDGRYFGYVKGIYANGQSRVLVKQIVSVKYAPDDVDPAISEIGYYVRMTNLAVALAPYAPMSWVEEYVAEHGAEAPTNCWERGDVVTNAVDALARTNAALNAVGIVAVGAVASNAVPKSATNAWEVGSHFALWTKSDEVTNAVDALARGIGTYASNRADAAYSLALTGTAAVAYGTSTNAAFRGDWGDAVSSRVWQAWGTASNAYGAATGAQASATSASNLAANAYAAATNAGTNATAARALTLAQSASNGGFAGTESIGPLRVLSSFYGIATGTNGATTNEFNVFAGDYAGNNVTGSYNTALGGFAMRDTIGHPHGVTFLGTHAGEQFNFGTNSGGTLGAGAHALHYSAGKDQTGVGTYALYASTGDLTSALGYYAAGFSTSTGGTMGGMYSGAYSFGNYNSFWGTSSGYGSTGNYNSALGGGSGQYSLGNNWHASGRGTGYGSIGDEWSAFARYSGMFAIWTNSVSLGYRSGWGARGENRMYIGNLATNAVPDINDALYSPTNIEIFVDNGAVSLGRGGSYSNMLPQTNTLRGMWAVTADQFPLIDFGGGSGWTNLAFAGTGNAITNATATGATLTLERGTIEGGTGTGDLAATNTPTAGQMLYASDTTKTNLYFADAPEGGGGTNISGNVGAEGEPLTYPWATNVTILAGTNLFFQRIASIDGPTTITPPTKANITNGAAIYLTVPPIGTNQFTFLTNTATAFVAPIPLASTNLATDFRLWSSSGTNNWRAQKIY